MIFYGYLLLFTLFLIECFEIFLTYLNLKHIKDSKVNTPPERLFQIFDKKDVYLAFDYQSEKGRLDIIRRICNIPFFYLLFISGYIQIYSSYLNRYFHNDIIAAVIFFSSFAIYSFLINLPFTLYDIFTIDQKYHFNKMTLPLFIRDTLISGVISLVIMVVLLAVITFLKNNFQDIWWLCAALFVSLFLILLNYIYPVFIAPIFNKFEKIEDNDLINKISHVTEVAHFPLEKIFKMDASKRSTHSNAYFTGFGSKRRVVLFDTLLNNHSNDEIVSILAHEIGHYKLGHIKKGLILSNVSIFILFFLIGLMINRDFIYSSFGFEQRVYIGLFLSMLFLSPLNFIVQPLFSYFSRRHEYQADNFAINITKKGEIFIQTIIKLYKDNLANPYPHPLYKIFYYSHPTLFERIENINRGEDK